MKEFLNKKIKWRENKYLEQKHAIKGIDHPEIKKKKTTVCGSKKDL